MCIGGQLNIHWAKLHTRDAMRQDVIITINEIEELGKTQAKAFTSKRIENKPIYAPITTNKLALYSTADTSSSQSATRAEKKDLKKDVNLFAQPHVATQVRGGDIQELFNYMTNKELPSLANKW